MKLRIALLQMAAGGSDQDANRAKGEAFCRQARALHADVALFPEMWNIGYGFFDEQDLGARARWAAQAVGPDDAFVAHFRGLARELAMAIALTYLERWPGAPRNSVSLIDRRGTIVLTQAKVHTCEWGAESACTPGDAFGVVPLETAAGPVEVGAMICFDREFPESARVLMLQGAELILTPNACNLEINRLSQFRARAYENMLAVAMANYAAPKCNGHSIAFDGISCDERDGQDMLLVEAGREEGVYIATLDLDRLRAYRARYFWGNAYRRPGRYGLLTSPAVLPPFVRAKATR